MSDQQLNLKPSISPAKIGLQRTAWGSNSSIPDLIKQQIQRQRPSSATNHKGNKPNNSIKKRPHSAKLQIYNGAERFHLHMITGKPPPAPCVSPDLKDEDKNTMYKLIASVNESPNIEEVDGAYTPMAKLIPEPLHLMLPSMGLEEDEDHEISTERLLEAANGATLTAKSGFSYMNASCIKSPHLPVCIPFVNDDTCEIMGERSEEEDELLSVHNDSDDHDDDGNITKPETEYKTQKNENEEKSDDNETDLLLPRNNTVSIMLKSGRKDFRNVRSRTDSGLNSLRSQSAMNICHALVDEKKHKSPSQYEKASKNFANQRSSSAKTFFVPATVGLAYGYEGGTGNKSISEKKGKINRKKDEIDTVIQDIELSSSDDESDNIKKSENNQTDIKAEKCNEKYLSLREKNYYEFSRSNLKSTEESGLVQPVKSVKTMELVNGALTEQKETSVLMNSISPSSKPTIPVHKHVPVKQTKELWDSNGRRINHTEHHRKPRPRNTLKKPEKAAVSPYQEKISVPFYSPAKSRSANNNHLPKPRLHNRACLSRTVSTALKSRTFSAPQSRDLHRKENAAKPREVLYINTRERNKIPIMTEGMNECKKMHMKLLDSGLDVPIDTLARALLPPTGSSVYLDSRQAQALPTNYSSGLLSSPAVWLSKEFRRLKLAEKALRRAEERLVMQQKAQERKTQGLETSKKMKGKNMVKSSKNVLTTKPG